MLKIFISSTFRDMHAKRTNKARKLHKDLLPWHDLSDDEQERDRVLVKGIPRILEKAGYTMARSG